MIDSLWLIDEPNIAIDAIATRSRLKDISHIGLKDQPAVAKGEIIHQAKPWVGLALFKRLRIEVLNIKAAPMFAATGMIGGRDHSARLTRRIGHTTMPHTRVSKADTALRNGHPRGRA